MKAKDLDENFDDCEGGDMCVAYELPKIENGEMHHAVSVWPVEGGSRITIKISPQEKELPISMDFSLKTHIKTEKELIEGLKEIIQVLESPRNKLEDKDFF